MKVKLLNLFLECITTNSEKMIVGIIQARIGSTRLPGKVLLEVNGRTMFEYLLERVRKCKTIDKIILATSINKIDDPLESLALSLGVEVFRGSENDVLERFYQAATIHKATHVVRLLNDCPLLDPEIVDEIVSYYLENNENLDFLSNQNKHTYPDGMDVSVFSFKALKKLQETSGCLIEREHVVPGFWANDNNFIWQNYHNKIDLFKTYRLTLDYEEDFYLIKEIIKGIYSENESFNLNDILFFLNKNSHLNSINNKYINY